MKAATRRARITSLSGITCEPAVTAMRSRFSPAAVAIRIAKMSGRVISKRLSQREVKLKLIDALRYAAADSRKFLGRELRVAREQLVQCALESVKTRRIRAETKIDADVAYRCAVADS